MPKDPALRALVGAATIVIASILASRFLGLVRNVVISSQYGASRDYEMFLVAIGVPDAVFQVLAGGAVGAAFIPVFAAHAARGDMDHAWRLTSALLNLAVLATGSVAGILAVAAPVVISVLAPGWSVDEQARAADLTRFMLISPVIFALSTLVTSALNSLQRFALAALAPLAYNLSIIAAALTLRQLGAEGLAFGAVVGALLHLLVQVPGLLQVRMKYSPVLGLEIPGVREVARLMGPRAIGLGISQANHLVGIAIASTLGAGSIAYLNYAWLVLMVPLGVFAMGLSTAIFPTLASQSASEQREEARETFLFGLRLILYATVPAAVVLALLGEPIVGVLLQRGEFSPLDSKATAVALSFFALGLPGHALVEIVDRAFYAERDTATPVAVGGIAAGIHILLALMLVQTALSYAGLALANSCAALVEAGVLGAILHRRTGWFSPWALWGFICRIGLAAGATALVLALAGRALPSVDAGIGAQEAAFLGGLILVGCGTYVASARALGVDDGVHAVRLLLRR